MHGLAIALLSLAPTADPVELPKDVVEIDTHQFALPLQCNPERQRKIERVGVFVSTDHGATWTRWQDYRPTDDVVQFTAPRDGLYWFAVQVVFTDGERQPGSITSLAASLKARRTRAQGRPSAAARTGIFQDGAAPPPQGSRSGP